MTGNKIRAFEAFRRQRMSMLGAFSAWLKTRPDTEEVLQEASATSDVMIGLFALEDANEPENMGEAAE